jgi:hypothetical protein
LRPVSVTLIKRWLAEGAAVEVFFLWYLEFLPLPDEPVVL